MKKTFEEQLKSAVQTLLIWNIVLTVAVVGVLALAIFGFAKASSDAQGLKKSVQSPTHGKDIRIWCEAINTERDYERAYSTGTLKQSETEAQSIEQAIANPNAHGLTSAQAAFIRLYLGSVVALEREAPQTLSLHPFTLGDLNCAQVEAGEAASAKH